MHTRGRLPARNATSKLRWATGKRPVVLSLLPTGLTVVITATYGVVFFPAFLIAPARGWSGIGLALLGNSISFILLVCGGGGGGVSTVTVVVVSVERPR